MTIFQNSHRTQTRTDEVNLYCYSSYCFLPSCVHYKATGISRGSKGKKEQEKEENEGKKSNTYSRHVFTFFPLKKERERESEKIVFCCLAFFQFLVACLSVCLSVCPPFSLSLSRCYYIIIMMIAGWK